MWRKIRLGQPGSGKPSLPSHQADAWNSHKHSYLGTHRQEDIHTNIYTQGAHSTSWYKQVHTDTLHDKHTGYASMLHTQGSPGPCAYPHTHAYGEQTGTDRYIQTRAQRHASTFAQRCTGTHIGTHQITGPPPPAGSWLPAKCSAFCWVCTTFHRL